MYIIDNSSNKNVNVHVYNSTANVHVHYNNYTAITMNRIIQNNKN